MPHTSSLLLMLVVLCGCTRTVQEGAAPVERLPPDTPETAIKYNQVVVIDRSLQDSTKTYYDPEWSEWLLNPWGEDARYSKIAVERTDGRRTPTDTLEVFAILRNRTDFALQVEGRATFFDHDQIPIGDPTPWSRVFLNPESIETFRALSTTPEVSYYLIELREGRW